MESAMRVPGFLLRLGAVAMLCAEWSVFAALCAAGSVFAVLCAAGPAFAWGPEGHEIVAHIAADALTGTARAKVAVLLGGDARATMMRDSTWADEIRDDRPDTAAWHFVNIEVGSAGYAAARDCPGGNCVVFQIEKDARILADARNSPATRAEALRFLIHFVGDIHQPLHAADRDDRGGNLLAVSLGGRRTSLHHVWDNDVVAALGTDPARVARAIEGGITPAQRAAWSGGAPAGWATESFALAERAIYAQLPKTSPGAPVALPGDYPRKQRAIVTAQLARAGLRLGALLNRILE